MFKVSHEIPTSLTIRHVGLAQPDLCCLWCGRGGFLLGSGWSHENDGELAPLSELIEGIEFPPRSKWNETAA